MSDDFGNADMCALYCDDYPAPAEKLEQGAESRECAGIRKSEPIDAVEDAMPALG